MADYASQSDDTAIPLRCCRGNMSWGSQIELASSAGPYVATSALTVLAGKEYTNILPNAQQLNGPTWGVVNAAVNVNTASAPDGTHTAATIVASNGSTDTFISANVMNPSLYDQETVTASVYLRSPAGSKLLNIYLVQVGDNGWDASIAQTATLNSGWQRFSITGTLQNGLTHLHLQIGGGGSYTGGQSVEVWGPQLVIGAAAAPYLGASGGTVTNLANGQPGTLMQNGLNQTYAYDSFGNILQNGSFNSTYTVNNQMFGYAYDAAGNLLSDGINVMTWDAESRLSSAGGATYSYDPLGNRVGKQGVGLIDTVYFGGRPIARFTSGQWTDLVYGPTGLLAEVPGTQNGAPVYTVSDHLGTTVGNLQADGMFINPLDYTPFGRIFSGNTSDPYLFTGKERDAESGLDYFGARYYGSSMGRFMSPDWSQYPNAVPYADLGNPQSLNLYAYVNNNPLRYRDADGHTHQECAPDTSSTGKDGSITVTAGACRSVPDWYNFGTRFMNWRQKQADAWNARIEAHQAPPQKPDDPDAALRAITDTMTIGTVCRTPERQYLG